MCGTFGIVQNKPGVDGALVEELVRANLGRGDRSWGLFCWSPTRSMVLRSTEKWREGLTVQVPWTPDHGTDVSWAQVVLGHVRAPTSGESRLLDTHPFETERLLLAMNGIFTKVEEASVESRVDTADLAWYLDTIQHRSIPYRIVSAMEGPFQGQAACWMWDKREEKLYLWRATNPLYFDRDLLEHDVTRFVFSSTMEKISRKLLREGVVYGLDPRSTEPLDLWRTCSFKVSSIYSFVDVKSDPEPTS